MFLAKHRENNSLVCTLHDYERSLSVKLPLYTSWGDNRYGYVIPVDGKIHFLCVVNKSIDAYTIDKIGLKRSDGVYVPTIDCVSCVLVTDYKLGSDGTRHYVIILDNMYIRIRISGENLSYDTIDFDTTICAVHSVCRYDDQSCRFYVITQEVSKTWNLSDMVLMWLNDDCCVVESTPIDVRETNAVSFAIGDGMMHVVTDRNDVRSIDLRTGRMVLIYMDEDINVNANAISITHITEHVYILRLVCRNIEIVKCVHYTRGICYLVSLEDSPPDRSLWRPAFCTMTRGGGGRM